MARGVFKYKQVDERGNTVSPTENVNQGNVKKILNSVPEIEGKTVEQ